MKDQKTEEKEASGCTKQQAVYTGY